MSEDITVQVSNKVLCPFQEVTQHWTGYCKAPGEPFGISCDFSRTAESKPPKKCPLRKGRIIVEWNPE